MSSVLEYFVLKLRADSRPLLSYEALRIRHAICINMWRESYVTLYHYGWLSVVEALYRHDALSAGRTNDYPENILGSKWGYII